MKLNRQNITEFLTKSTKNFWRKTTTTQDGGALNKLSLIFIILIDIFVLVNVFQGIGFASEAIPTTNQIYPCYSEFQTVRSEGFDDEDKFEFLTVSRYNSSTYDYAYYNRNSADFSGNTLPYLVDEICNRTGTLNLGVQNSDFRVRIYKSYTSLENEIRLKNRQIETLKDQYDSSLLESIANQNREDSINLKSSTEIKAEIDKLEAEIDQQELEIENLKQEFLSRDQVKNYYNYVLDSNNYNQLKTNYDNTSRWYPTQVFLAQVVFLLPLIIGALIWHKFSLKKGHQLQGLLSWNLFVVFLIPAIFKVFEFTQAYLIFSLLAEIISAIFGGLYVFASYFSIILIPLIGYGLLKFLQRFVFNKRVLIKKRVNNCQCWECGRKIQTDQEFCSFCGSSQFRNCSNCKQATFKHLAYCRKCGHKDETLK